MSGNNTVGLCILLQAKYYAIIYQKCCKSFKQGSLDEMILSSPFLLQWQWYTKYKNIKVPLITNPQTTEEGRNQDEKRWKWLITMTSHHGFKDPSLLNEENSLYAVNSNTTY